MSKTYKTRYGFDWPADMPDELIGLTIGKKWREFKDAGIEFKDPWEPFLESAKSLYGDALVVTPWTEQHFHDWVMEPFLLTWGCASSGKFTTMTEPVFTPTGVTTVGSLSVGDYIIAATGHPARVEKIFEQEDRPLYIVRFGDGTETVCGDEHLWTVRYWGRVRWEGSCKTRKAVYGFVTRTMTTERLASWTDLRRRRASVPLTEPVEFNHREVPVDPYMLGCLIGDGSLCGTISLTSHPDDAELRGRFRRGLVAKFPGYELHAVKGSRGTAWLVTGLGRGHANAVKSALRDLGLFGHRAETKFVPDMYKFNSADVRFELLAGLFDTDGTVSKKGHVSYCTVSKRLAEDVKFLLQSVGASATVSTKTPTYTHNGVRRSGQTAYTVYVHGLKKCYMRRLFHLSRKRNRIRSLRTEGYKSIESVTRVVDRASYPSRTRCITLSKYDTAGNLVEGLYPIGNFTVTHNSNDTGALIVLDWVIDPYDTVTLVGSTTRDALKLRSWESIQRYFRVLKQNSVFSIPGKESVSGCAILNDREKDDDPGAQGSKAGIHGVALNDGGKLQGAHLPYVRLVIDELATIFNHQDILTTIENLQIAKDFRFVGLANPESWSNPSCQYAIPEAGIDSVNVDTGSWRSSFGCFVRHHDGFKSPCVVDPSLGSKYPFLTQKRHVEAALRRAGGNADAPHFWKMVRGFPLPAGNSGQTVLDEAIAIRNHATDPAPSGDRIVTTAAGIDPAWTESGDSACYARCYLKEDMFGKPYLDFTNGLRKMTLNASEFKRHPAVEQLRTQVIGFMREPFAAPFRQTAIDSSGNQSLADDLIIYAAAQDILAVNFATRASEEPLRAFDTQKTKDTIYDRGTEAWCVLAEFIRAGQVRGLPQTVVEALVNRRYAANMVKDASGQKVPAGVKNPLRLEDKEEFKKRYHGRSPDECDACAMAALAIKERCGLLPFGYIKQQPDQSALVPQVNCGAKVILPVGDADFGTEFDDTDDLYGDI